MMPEQEVEYILDDCFLAVGGAIGDRKQLDPAAIVWWRDRYRDRFLHAITGSMNSWVEDRVRVLAVSRFLGTRAVAHAGDRPVIDRECAIRASAEIEAGCDMRRLQTDRNEPAAR
jgi:hypothetical protein